MKCIILAAGKGSRIPEFSIRKPKCLIKIKGKEILKRQLIFFRKLNIKEIIVIRGHKKNYINFKKVKYISNKNYKTNEQLDSLLIAKKEFNTSIIISFSDIIYDFKVIKKLINDDSGNIILAIDKKWKKKYKFRYDHPLDQADKVELNKIGEVKDIGKEISVKKTHAEFLGLFKISEEGSKIFIKYYNKLRKLKANKMQIHHFIKFLVKKKVKVNTCSVQGKFMEIDTYNDYIIAKKMFKNR